MLNINKPNLIWLPKSENGTKEINTLNPYFISKRKEKRGLKAQIEEKSLLFYSILVSYPSIISKPLEKLLTIDLQSITAVKTANKGLIK